MKTGYFDAVVKFSVGERIKPVEALLIFKVAKVPASFYFYEQAQEEKPEQFFARIHPCQPLSLKWKDRFKVQEQRKRHLLGEGRVLNPYSEKINRKEIKKRVAFLRQLQGDEKDMLLALVKEKGVQGLREREIVNFCSLAKSSLQRFSQELEAEGKLKILCFSPLFLLSQRSFDYLCERILTFLAGFHKNYSHRTGASLERIRRRFGVDQKIISLALKHLLRAGQTKELRGKIALSDFKIVTTVEEEQVLEELEKMCFKGEFRSISSEDLQRRFRLSSERLHQMLSMLIERKKIVKGKDGFILHSRWLDEIVWRVKSSGKKELTVTDFKEMTGLTRKYAIPLLELLDQMGVTRRKGSSRKIL